MYFIKDGVIEFIYRRNSTINNKTIIFIHGECSNAFFWEQQMIYFSEHFNVIVLNIFNDNLYDFNLCNYSDIISGFIRKIEFSSLIICGFSLGGALVLELLHRFGDTNKITGIIINTPVRYQLNPLFLDLICNNYDDYLYLIYSVGISKKSIKFDAFKKVHKCNKNLTLISLKAYREFNFFHKCKDVSIPVLLISSRRSNLFSIENSIYYKEHIKNTSLFVDNSSSHFLSLEKPDKINSIIHKYIQLQRDYP